MKNGADYLAPLLRVTPDLLKKLDAVMAERVGRVGVLETVANENEAAVSKILERIGVKDKNDFAAIRNTLKEVIVSNEKRLLKYVGEQEGKNEFEKAVSLSRKIAKAKKGFFLKKERGEAILHKRPPENILRFFDYKSVSELLARHDVEEVFSVLRFMEPEEWMHETFEKAYGEFTKEDFEEREIETRVLGPEWQEVAKKFVAKKHHNVSHLKEFGVIILNPIKEDIPGKFIRDFALLLHYYHEIEFYSELFRRSADKPGFADNLKSLLRGDVRETTNVEEGEWLIVQRYLWKIDPRDPRLFLPRVNPESMHWARGERDIVELGKEEKDDGLFLWHDSDFAGLMIAGGDVISFDLEDNAMSEVSAAEGKQEHLSYHEREALWTRMFREYVGGEAEMERLLLENFRKGSVMFPKK